ncbi:MAG: phosphotransferase [Patescibacteria group bacterium]
MIEFRRNTDKLTKQENNIRVKINSSFSSEFSGTPLYYGALEDGTNVVLKFPKGINGALREYNGLSLATLHNIPSPKAIALIQRKEQPSEGLIMEKIDGKALDEIGNITHEFKLGQIVNKLHQIQVPKYGPLVDGSGSFENATGYLKHWLGKTIQHIGEQNQAVPLLNDLYKQGEEHIINQEPRLLHRDLKDDNIIIQSNGELSLIDFEWAQGGNPHDDLGVYLYHSIRTNKSNERMHAFFTGYFNGKEITDQEKYDLLFHLILAAGRTVSFCTRFNQSRLDEANMDMTKVLKYVDKTLSSTPGYPN